jgi:hypothetical protein
MTRTDQRAIMRVRRCACALWAVLMSSLATAACAEVRVQGSPAAMRVTTSQDAISDVLAAIATTFNVQYRTSIPLDALASVTYSGSFGQVISRLLDGYNYVIKREQDTTEIVVFGRRGEVAIVPPAPKAPPTKSIMSQWR